MSRPRNKWWSYVKWMIRLYPARVEELRRRQAAALTPRYNAQPGGAGDGRTTEALATVSLGEVVDREMEAVRIAIEETRRQRFGAERLRLIDLIFWKKTHTLTGACAACHVSERTGQQWHAEFIHRTARAFGLEESGEKSASKSPGEGLS